MSIQERMLKGMIGNVGNDLGVVLKRILDLQEAQVELLKEIRDRLEYER